jgi:hypothetical protein
MADLKRVSAWEREHVFLKLELPCLTHSGANDGGRFNVPELLSQQGESGGIACKQDFDSLSFNGR